MAIEAHLGAGSPFPFRNVGHSQAAGLGGIEGGDNGWIVGKAGFAGGNSHELIRFVATIVGRPSHRQAKKKF